MAVIDLLYFQQNPVFGATEQYLYDLAERIDKRKFRVHLVFPDLPVMEKFALLRENGVILHPSPPHLSTGSIARALPRLTHLFRKVRPSIVHFNDPAIVGILAARLAGVPLSIMTHHTPELDRRYNVAGRLLERLAFLCRPRVIFTSEPSRNLGLRKDKVPYRDSAVIPYGLREEWFAQPDARVRARTRAGLGVSEDSVVVLNAARLSKQKRHDSLIEAARRLMAGNDREHVMFLVAGEGELRQEMQAMIRAADMEGSFRLLGHRPDVREIMSASDIFVMPSDFEGLCYAVLEASARGLPVVATRVGGMRFSVKHGETGLLVSPGDATALTEALASLVRNPSRRRSFGEAGAERARRLFTVERMVRDTEAAYLHWLRQRKRPQ
jgi:glycosyltransferase involved in cell wall biosynthesis